MPLNTMRVMESVWACLFCFRKLWSCLYILYFYGEKLYGKILTHKDVESREHHEGNL